MLSRRCKRRGHDWFPALGPREFICTTDLCLRCDARRTVKPYGICLSGHPLSEHYRDDGSQTATPTCAGPS